MRVAAVGLFAAMLAGCQSFSSASSFAHVRVIEVSPDTPAVDIYKGNNAVAYNLSFGTITSYVPITPGNYTMTVDSAGSRQVLSSVKGAFSAGMNYTVLVGNSAANLEQLILADQGQPLQPAAPSIRLINQAALSGAVDVYLVPAGQRITSVSPVATNLAFGVHTGYLPVAAGKSTVIMLPAGTVPTGTAAAVHTGVQADYVSGSARTLILLDQQPATSPSLQVITAMDADPAS